MDQESFYSDIALLQSSELHVRKALHNRICACFEDLWSCIQGVLCADAPEGHVPEEFEEEASLDTKEVLSYSWRGLKEARYIPHAPLNQLALTHPASFSVLLSPKHQ